MNSECSLQGMMGLLKDTLHNLPGGMKWPSAWGLS